jgi:hypothetical protein
MDDERSEDQPDDESPWSIERMKGWVSACDPRIVDGTVEMEAALVLMAAVQMGHKDRDQLAEFTGVPLDRVNEFAEPLECDGLWRPDGTVDYRWTEEETTIAAFWCDVLVALGLVKRMENGVEYIDRVLATAN